MKGWFTDKFRRVEHVAQVETIVSPSDCPRCIELERNARAASASGNYPLAAEIRVQALAHCRKDHRA